MTLAAVAVLLILLGALIAFATRREREWTPAYVVRTTGPSMDRVTISRSP